MVSERLSVKAERECRVLIQSLGVLERDRAIGQDDAVGELAERRRAATRTSPLEHSLGREGNDARVPIVGLHELLDPQGDAVDETELLRDILLVAKRQPVLLPPRPKVEQVPDTPQELPRRLELA